MEYRTSVPEVGVMANTKPSRSLRENKHVPINAIERGGAIDFIVELREAKSQFNLLIFLTALKTQIERVAI
jgi:hypothetical protein